jgi:antitoxin component YwqK of YwqJK toxin-antitoxin module
VWFENGEKLEANFVDSKQNGLTTRWYKNGKKAFEVNFVDDKTIGKTTYYSE